MKKSFLIVFLCIITFSAKAQFSAGTKYVGASTTGLSLSYSSSERLRLGLDMNAGYFVANGWMLKAGAGYEHTRRTDDVRIGAGFRYYMTQNGIFLGTGLEYNHFTKSNNDLMIPTELGYAFYINRYVTIEPSVYYKMSLHDFSNNSTVGIRLGLGYYF